MVRIYFLGGENVVKRDAREINMLAFQEAGGAPAVLVFPWARPSFDASYKRRKRLNDYFLAMGARSVEFIGYSDSLEETAAKLRQSDLVYLTGGQVSTLLSRLRKRGIDRLLRVYQGVIVGRSAGAVVLGRKCLVTSRYSGKARVVEGLGLTEFSVKAHYEASKDDLLMKLSKSERVFAVPQSAALVYNKGGLSFVGEVSLFVDGEKIRCH